MSTPIDAFGWAEVAAIAGAALVCLMALLGVLLGILLKRQTESKEDGVKKVKEIQELVVAKLDAEVADRKEEIKEIKSIVEQGRVERRHDIGVLHKKLELGFIKAVSDFKEMCDYRQGQCSELQKSYLDGVRNQTLIACKKIEKIEGDQGIKWEKQEKFNMRCMTESKREVPI